MAGKITNAQITLPAGTTVAGSAPLKLTTQASPLTVVEQGTMELVGNSLQFTQLAKRRGVAMSQNVIISDTTIVGGGAETGNVLVAEQGANYPEIGKCVEMIVRGTMSQRSNVNATFSMKVYYGAAASETLRQTITTTASSAIGTGTPFEMRVTATFRTVGAGSGSIQLNTVFWIDGVANVPDSALLISSLDTTVATNLIIRIAAGTDNNATNTLTANQGRVLCIETQR